MAKANLSLYNYHWAEAQCKMQLNTIDMVYFAPGFSPELLIIKHLALAIKYIL